MSHTHISHTHISHITHIIVLTHTSLVSNSIGGSWGWRWVHEERVSQAARQRCVLCRVSARFSEAQQNSARLGRVLSTRCAHTGVSGPTPGGARPPPLMFCLIPGPPNAPPLSGGGGIASTLLLTRSGIDTGSRARNNKSEKRSTAPQRRDSESASRPPTGRASASLTN